MHVIVFGPSAVHAEALPAYVPVREDLAKLMAEAEHGAPDAAGQTLLGGHQRRKPAAARVLRDRRQPVPPAHLADRLKTWSDWANLAARAHGEQIA
ncbi:hypothetical protein [Streptomyces sp. NPDC127033]|uniref:hypothetical protein n=1 Tax=Streptomyces sp. NPDC127033 TaxID=3347110 RepID=UPI00365EEA7A